MQRQLHVNRCWNAPARNLVDIIGLYWSHGSLRWDLWSCVLYRFWLFLILWPNPVRHSKCKNIYSVSQFEVFGMNIRHPTCKDLVSRRLSPWLIWYSSCSTSLALCIYQCMCFLMNMHVCMTSKVPWNPDLEFSQEQDDLTWYDIVDPDDLTDAESAKKNGEPNYKKFVLTLNWNIRPSSGHIMFIFSGHWILRVRSLQKQLGAKKSLRLPLQIHFNSRFLVKCLDWQIYPIEKQCNWFELPGGSDESY